MRVTLFVEPHRGATYDDQLRLARHAEDAGFEGFLRADHYQSMGADPGLPGPDRRLDHAGRPGPRDLPDPARHPGQLGDVPAARAAGHHGRAGRRDERRPDRPGHGRRLAGARAHVVRHPVPAAGRAVRPDGRAARDHHRPVVHPRRRALLLRRQALPAAGRAGAAQAGAAAGPADPGRRPGPETHARAGRPLRGRVQHAVQERGRDGGGLRPGQAGLRHVRPARRPQADAVRGHRGRPGPHRRRGPAPGRPAARQERPAAGGPGGRRARTGWSSGSARWPRSAPTGCICG